MDPARSRNRGRRRTPQAWGVYLQQIHDETARREEQPGLTGLTLRVGSVAMDPGDSHVEASENGISRRKLLKRIGTGAAVAWSAPILTSIRTPAFAQGSAPVCAPGCPACQFGAPCMTGCACVGIPVDCFCSNSGACQSGMPICTKDSDCTQFTGPGSKCAQCVFDPSCTQSSCWGPCPGGELRVPRGRGIRVIRPAR